MTKRISGSAIELFRQDGILAPLPAVGAREAARLLARLEALEAREGGRLSAGTNQKPHLLLPWLFDVVHHSSILDAVEDLIGPNIFCWYSAFFAKNPSDGSYVSWHQDSTYWGLSTPDVVTAWVAFTPSTVDSGCMRVMPGSHLLDQLPHRDTFAEANLLTRGQEVAVEVDESQARDVVLEPGQMSVHHVRLVHGSRPNQSHHRRIGFAIRYVAAHVRQASGKRDSGTLVRGTDAYGHFEHEPGPKSDFHPEAVAFHADMRRRINEIFYRGADRVPHA